MGSLRPDGRAVANGARQAMNNTGYTLSTALSLAVVTAPLDPDVRRVAYAGAIQHLSVESIRRLPDAFRLTLFIAAGLG